MGTDSDHKTSAARANAVDTDIERDSYFLKKLAEHRAAATNDPKLKDALNARAHQGDKVLENPNFATQRGLDVELRRLHPSRTRRCSDDLEANCALAGITMEHIGTTIGTVLHGPDLSRRQSQQVIDTIRQVLLERKVVFFREQQLTREQHLEFGARFGTLEIHPFAPPLLDHPKILEINHNSNSPGTENVWHSDVTWRAEPSLGSILYCTHAPEFGGGDTLFSDSHAQYEGLPKKLRAQANGMNAVHDFVGFRKRAQKSGVPKEVMTVGIEHAMSKI
jgi:hypothetical protein